MRRDARLVLRTVVALSLGLCSALAGCDDDDDPYLPPIVRADSGIVSGADASIDAALPPSGLPCDVQAVLATYCSGCHGATPAGGATGSLVTREQLLADSLTRPGTTVLAVAIDRMHAGSMPPAPAAAVPAIDIATIEAWLAAGTPEGTCDTPNDPFGGPDTCTSGTTWTGGNTESPLMRPGGACISCHTSMREGPSLSIAGTVYGSGREVDDCNGLRSTSADPIVVEVTDATGRVIALTPNAAGNFFFEEDFVPFPATAVVRYQGRERRMSTPVPHGDCNACHTLRGAMMAPGRIVVP
jgi:mono/diheme cytochrome c family protein